MKTIGILSLQGSVEEHRASLSRLCNVREMEVRTPDSLEKVDGIILPGGESTTISKLLRTFGLFEPLRGRIQAGMPVWGTCAGMILLAKEVVGEAPHLGVMDIAVRRNAYGRQADSFSVKKVLPEIHPAPIPLVFIRAPWIERAGPGAKALCEVDGRIVAARQKNMLVTSFHPELTDDLSVHRYFAGMVSG